MVKSYTYDTSQRAANAVFGFLARRGWGAGYRWILSVPGRNSGTIRSTPVDVMTVDGQRWLVAAYGETNWVRNVRAHPRIILRRGHRAEELVAHPATADDRVVAVIREYLRCVPITASYWAVTADASDAEIRRESETHPVFRLDLRR